MKISKTIWAVIAALVVAGGLFLFVSNASTTSTNTSEQTQIEQVEVSAGVVINEDGTVVAYRGVEGETALATLKALAVVRVEESSFGEFVTGIGEVDADGSQNFWGFYVNGEMAAVGAGDYTAAEGDEIEWRLTELN